MRRPRAQSRQAAIKSDKFHTVLPGDRQQRSISNLSMSRNVGKERAKRAVGPGHIAGEELVHWVRDEADQQRDRGSAVDWRLRNSRIHGEPDERRLR
jgi:hypothetical protein